jgi:hypothetical protein
MDSRILIGIIAVVVAVIFIAVIYKNKETYTVPDLNTSAGQAWLGTSDGYAWLNTSDGQNWLNTSAGQAWLSTSDGYAWLGQGWSWFTPSASNGTSDGQNWLNTRAGQAWLNWLRQNPQADDVNDINRGDLYIKGG